MPYITAGMSTSASDRLATPARTPLEIGIDLPLGNE